MPVSISNSCQNCTTKTESIFCNLHSHELDSLSNHKSSCSYKRGQTVFVEDSPVHGFFCIQSGKVKIAKTSPDGKETILRIAHNGDIIGHRSLFSTTPYQATATVLEEAEICFVPKQIVLDLVRSNPKFSLEIMNKISLQMGAAEERIANLSQLPMKKRFVKLLLTLKEAFGKTTSSGIEIDLKLSRDEIASLVGASTENIIRLISDFKSGGVLSLEGKKIVIMNLKKLESLSPFDY